MKTINPKTSYKELNKDCQFSHLVLIAMAFVTLSLLAATPLSARTYTTDADFDEGALVGVEHETVHDQLQLSKTPVTLPFIWVPNNNGTVSKVHTETGNELGRYRVAPHSDCSPSRTTVDLDGSCWVGNRQAGTVVKIGLYEAGIWIDRNHDGICQTSQDLDHDGDITGGEILPWGNDECVLYEIILIPGKVGTYVPGTYGLGYDYNYWGTAPRGLAIDAQNNLWAGTTSSMKYYYIDGKTGTVLKVIDVSPWNHNAYGAVIDKYGILWSSDCGRAWPDCQWWELDDIWMDPSTDPPTIGKWNPGHFVYGIGVDYLGHLFATGFGTRMFSKLDILTHQTEWSYYKNELDLGRGVVCTEDNNVWVVASSQNRVYRYDNDGNYKAEVYVGSYPTGVAVDAAGKVWSCNYYDEYISRIDPTTNAVDLWKQVVGSGGHYSYSDMTGIIARTITTKIGTWTVVHDSGEADTEWGIICWNSDVPEGASITVKVSSSDDQISWSPWETAGNAVPLSATPDGRFLKVEATLQIISGEESPVLYDLTVLPANLPPDCGGAVASISEIWPPDHRMVPVNILGVTDPDGDPVSIIITAITSDEPTASDEGPNGPVFAPDAAGVGTNTAWLRAQRFEKGNGRIYQISFKADDGKGGTCSCTVQVGVPHDLRGNHICVDDGQNYDATQIN